ncbi:MAG TPA: hypothetical protein VHX65_07940 [Pirellulales bacterium]|nr:hypothetical protein [Pirellulales bacterium]
MAKATELDKDLADGLKAAKSKRCYFALVLKGGTDGAMVVSKTKIPAPAIADAKKKSGGSSIVSGFVSYADGAFLFETAKLPPATAAAAAKTIVKRDAEMSIHAVFRISADPELTAEQGGSPATPSQKPPTLDGRSPAESAYNARVNALSADLKKAIASGTTAGNEAKLRFNESQAFSSNKDFAQALARIDAAEAQIKKALNGVPPAPSGMRRLNELTPKIKTALGAGGPNAARIQTLLASATGLIKNDELIQAEKVLDELEPLLDSPKGSGTVDLAAEWKKKLADWTPAIKAAIVAKGPNAAAITKLMAQASALSKPGGDMPEALAKLTECHELAKPAVIVRELEEKELKLRSHLNELQAQLQEVESEKLAVEFAGMSIDQIDNALFKQSEEALRALVASNNALLKASVQEEAGDPIGVARELQAKVAKDETTKDDIERKRELLEKMRDNGFLQNRGAKSGPPKNPVDEGDLREKLATAETDLAATEKSKEFHKKLAQFISVINSAVAEKPEIGGADVNVTFENGKQQADAGNWNKADELLVDAHRKAELVLKRKPFLTAKLANEPKINAAKKIKQVNPNSNKNYGDEVDATWKAILALAKNGKFDVAARDLAALVKTIDEQITPALEPARNENAKNLGLLKQQLETAKNDPGKLRKIATAIFKNTSEAEELGVDPGENARKPFEEETVGANTWNVANCEITFKRYDWFALKKCRKMGKIELEKGKPLTFTDDDMWKLVQFRGKVVNEEIDKLRKIYPTLIAKASGSEDIESDIDITFATPNSGDDVKAAQAFNKVVITRFGKPAGRVFDVNIYPRDYGAIKESFKPDYNVDEIVDHNIDEPEQEASMKLSKVDQDVATLLKQRRFLEEAQFNQMLQTLLDSSPDEAVKKRIAKQYEEGEDIYLQTSLEKVGKIRGKVDLNKKLPEDRAEKHRAALNKAIRQLDALKGKGGQENLTLAQRLVPEILDLFEETYPDESMDVTDALYLEKMGSLRDDQAAIRNNQKSIAALHEAPAAHPGKTCDELEHDECDWQKNLTATQTELNALEVKVKKNMFTNIIFANEAIMSQGALKHVVQALQAKTIEEKMEKLEKLTAEDLMQSVNEQVADLFKEMKHYDGVVDEAEEEAPEEEKKSAKNRANGEGYVHASKYFFRLLDAAISLNLKYPGEQTVQAPYDAIKNSGNKSLDQLKKQVDDILLKLRKSAVIPPEVKGEVGALEMQEVFPQVKNIPSFRTMISDFAIELNKRIRALPQFQQSKKDEDKQQQAQKEYGGVAESQRDKALGHVRALANKPAVVPNDLVKTLSELGIDPTVSANLFNAWQSAVNARPPVDLADLQSKLSAIADSEVSDELQAVARWFERANAMHALNENQATKAVAGEIKKARIAIENAEKLIGRVSQITDGAKKAARKLSEDEKKPLLAEIAQAKNEINNAQENVGKATPDGISTSATKMIAEAVSDLRTVLGNLDRRNATLNG